MFLYYSLFKLLLMSLTYKDSNREAELPEHGHNTWLPRALNLSGEIGERGRIERPWENAGNTGRSMILEGSSATLSEWVSIRVESWLPRTSRSPKEWKVALSASRVRNNIDIMSEIISTDRSMEKVVTLY